MLLDKREPVTALTLAILMRTSLAGLGTGAASLVTQQHYYMDLHISIDEDIHRYLHLPPSGVSVFTSRGSTTEQKGPRFIFLKEKWLCIALGEECCFYIDHSGIVKDSLAKVHKGLEKRKREH